MASKCAAITGKGQPCRGLVRPGNDYCPAHDPGRQEARRRAASKAGKGGANREIKDLKKQLEDLAADVLAGRLERGDAAVVNQVLNTRARLVELERKIKETEELEARLEALEEAASATIGEAGRFG